MNQGNRNTALRMLNAEAHLIDILVTLGAVDRLDAMKVAAHYKRQKWVKLDAVNGRYDIKHGALLDRETIQHVAAQP